MCNVLRKIDTGIWWQDEIIGQNCVHNVRLTSCAPEENALMWNFTLTKFLVHTRMYSTKGGYPTGQNSWTLHLKGHLCSNIVFFIVDLLISRQISTTGFKNPWFCPQSRTNLQIV